MANRIAAVIVDGPYPSEYDCEEVPEYSVATQDADECEIANYIFHGRREAISFAQSLCREYHAELVIESARE